MLTQAQVNPQEGPKAYDEYVKIRYPYLETAKKREKDETISRLLAEVNKGPLRITPLGDTSVKSKLHTKFMKTQSERTSEVASRLMRKIGSVMPL
jgi:hypothetical protein